MAEDNKVKVALDCRAALSEHRSGRPLSFPAGRRDKQLEELKAVLPKPYADYVPDFSSKRRS